MATDSVTEFSIDKRTLLLDHIKRVAPSSEKNFWPVIEALIWKYKIRFKDRFTQFTEIQWFRFIDLVHELDDESSLPSAKRDEFLGFINVDCDNTMEFVPDITLLDHLEWTEFCNFLSLVWKDDDEDQFGDEQDFMRRFWPFIRDEFLPVIQKQVGNPPDPDNCFEHWQASAVEHRLKKTRQELHLVGIIELSRDLKTFWREVLWRETGLYIDQEVVRKVAGLIAEVASRGEVNSHFLATFTSFLSDSYLTWKFKHDTIKHLKDDFEEYGWGGLI